MMNVRDIEAKESCNQFVLIVAWPIRYLLMVSAVLLRACKTA